MRVLQPANWTSPRGYSNGIEARGVVFVAGQIGWDENQKFQDKSFVGQFAQTLRNTLAVLAESGAGPQHIARMTWYITDKATYLSQAKEVGRVYREIMGRHFPAMAVVAVSSLMEDAALIEIETTAVLEPPVERMGARLLFEHAIY
ncbi:RidA family protein [Ferrovibrio sp.]|uniref:RidA family protein n=1 Tax=Ferrovibrio sp. TaxID=1917215 RepID=UPI00260B45EC|nr:RidA family protein [Ferrovibrio sp.]